ncbi:hypothetical protein GCM10011389_08440 [Pontibacillus salipaludis]|uniref:Uncharacterized protein n=1 Tax=Pontibacillus salipaludis TaxID=1697394 RepID=A0ABQ1PSZ8_9BACI|nr:hypothetical protein GCM10011389_08440 [Pontibacillus salipaludis]
MGDIRYAYANCGAVHIFKARACSGTARLPREKEPREDPAESVANEEASQLSAGKRAVPEQAQALINVGPFQLKYLKFEYPGGLIWNRLKINKRLQETWYYSKLLLQNMLR